MKTRRTAQQYRLAWQGVIPPETAWLAAADEDLSGVDVGSILSAARLLQQAVELLDLLEQELARRGAR